MIIDTVDLFSAPKTDNGSVAMLLKKSNGGINESLDIGLILHSAGYWSRWSEAPRPKGRGFPVRIFFNFI